MHDAIGIRAAPYRLNSSVSTAIGMTWDVLRGPATSSRAFLSTSLTVERQSKSRQISPFIGPQQAPVTLEQPFTRSLRHGAWPCADTASIVRCVRRPPISLCGHRRILCHIQLVGVYHIEGSPHGESPINWCIASRRSRVISHGSPLTRLRASAILRSQAALHFNRMNFLTVLSSSAQSLDPDFRAQKIPASHCDAARDT